MSKVSRMSKRSWLRVVAVSALAGGALGAQGSEARTAPAATAQPPAEPPAKPLQVLYLEDTPRWEYRYLKNSLLRRPDLVLKAFLFEASTDFPQDSTRGFPRLAAPPRTREELFAFDVVLIGDLPPEQIDHLEAPRLAWMKLLVEFVEEGGGVGFLAGPRATPDRYRGTPLEKLLPVVLEPARAAGEERAVSGVFRPQIVRPDDAITALVTDPAKNVQLWLEALPPLQRYYPVARAAEGAQVILTHPTDRNEHGPRVIAATAEHGKGRTFYIGVDETWRWRKPFGHTYQDRFWFNVVRYLGQRE